METILSAYTDLSLLRAGQLSKTTVFGRFFQEPDAIYPFTEYAVSEKLYMAVNNQT